MLEPSTVLDNPVCQTSANSQNRHYDTALFPHHGFFAYTRLLHEQMDDQLCEPSYSSFNNPWIVSDHLQLCFGHFRFLVNSSVSHCCSNPSKTFSQSYWSWVLITTSRCRRRMTLTPVFWSRSGSSCRQAPACPVSAQKNWRGSFQSAPYLSTCMGRPRRGQWSLAIKKWSD